MGIAAEAAYWLGYVLLAVAFGSSVLSAWRRREQDRLDVAFLVGLMLLAPLVRFMAPLSRTGAPTARLFLIFCYPYGLLRLVRHFRHISRTTLTASLLLAAAAAVALAMLSRGVTRQFVNSAVFLYVALAMGGAATLLGKEARRSAGVKARRLVFAAAGSWVFGLSFFTAGGGIWLFSAAHRLSTIDTAADGIGGILYFLAFATPQLLIGRWQREERVRYLAQAAGRDPEERATQAPDDLLQGAIRSIGGAETFVAIRSDTVPGEFVVRAASDSAAVGRILSPGVGLMGSVLGSGRPQVGPPSACEPDVAGLVPAGGVKVLVAPICATERWGMVAVVHRRGALFPDDDVAMLAQLGRDAAISLDHAHFIVQRRESVRLAADRRLRELELRMSLMIDSIKDYAMLLLDATGRIAGWHIGAQHLFGYTTTEMDDQSAASVYAMDPADFQVWLAEARARGSAEREGPCRRFDGSSFVGATIIRPLATEPDEPPGFVAVTRDVTERRKLEDRLRQGQKMEAIGQLAGGIAQDFNNLLLAILGYAEWLHRDLGNDPRRAHVGEIERAAERAADMTRQLLTFSRRRETRSVPVDLSQLVGDVVPMLRRLIDERIGIVDATTPELAVLGDHSQLEQVVMNLVVNARDAMPGGGLVTIRTANVWLGQASTLGLSAGPYVLLEVTDTGVGMTDEVRARAFEPFFTTKAVGTGTGLGLSTVYGIVKQMGGVVEIESELERGTTFKVYFPETGAAAGFAKTASPRALSRGNETVLLVEDDDGVRRYLQDVLEGHGYRVISAAHPNAAVMLTQTCPDRIHLVISDVVMPESTGPELVQLLGRDRPGLSALYISGYNEIVPVGEPDRTEPHAVLRKPFSSTELLTRIREILSAA